MADRDFLSISDFSRAEIESVLALASRLQKEPRPDLLKGKILGSCFFEPSTRTRLSFEAAMLRLGGGVVGFSEGAATSMQKGESLSDTMRVIGSYVDLIVIRHPQEGSAKTVAEASLPPVINAGDGANQHPTQALIDLFTIKECQGTIDGLHIAIVGDLKFGRAVHSLCLALGLYSVRLYFVSSKQLQLPETILKELKGAQFSLHQEVEEVISNIDLLYMSRIQKERSKEELSSKICSLKILEKAKPNLKILHPLPRVDEIEKRIDETEHAYYFEQAANAVVVRSALLAFLLGKIC